MLEERSETLRSPNLDVNGACRARVKAGSKNRWRCYSFWASCTSSITNFQNPLDKRCFPHPSNSVTVACESQRDLSWDPSSLLEKSSRFHHSKAWRVAW